MTPSMGAASKTLATSAAFVTSPPMTVRFGSLSGLSASRPPDPFGMTSFEGFLKWQNAIARCQLCKRQEIRIKVCYMSCAIYNHLVRPTTLSPSFNAWYTHSAAVKPDAPKTAIVFIFNWVLTERESDLHEAMPPPMGLVWETKENAEAVPTRQVNSME